VPIGRVFWANRPSDPTAPLTQFERVTKRRVREMFVSFVQNTPEMHNKPRDEQIRQFNLSRREANQPKIQAELLVDVLI
jgi:hypothetical protein